MPKGRGLYLHVPWKRGGVPPAAEGRYRAGVRAEAALLAARGLAIETRVVSFAVGGGDPLLLPEESIRSLLAEAADVFRPAPGCERTCEGAVRSIERGKLRALREAGFDRLCATGTEGEEAERVRAAVREAREAGFETVALDLAVTADVGSLLESAAFPAHDLDHVSLRETSGPPLGEEEWVRAYREASEILGGLGLERYEITHFARPGKRSRHLLLLHAGGDVIGLGAGALTSLGRLRRRNLADPERYAEAARAGSLPIGEGEELSDTERVRERVFLGLRRSRGVDPRSIGRGLALDHPPLSGEAIRRLAEAGFLAWAGRRIVLTERGIVAAERIVLELLS
ncbi:MAG: hypothetical protein ABIH26_07435 [Candidatus Eisenbacteria bacterium]